MLTRFDNGKVNESDEHGHDGAKCVEHAVGYVNLHVELVDEHGTEHKDWDDIDDK
jgi:hypothetical protein